MVALRVANDPRFPGAPLRLADLSPESVCRNKVSGMATCGAGSTCVVVHHGAEDGRAAGNASNSTL